MRDVVRTFLFFFSLSFRYFVSCTLVLWPLSDGKPCIHLIYIYIYIYIFDEVVIIFSHISPCVVSFLALYTCFLFIVCNLLFLFHTKMPWWVLFKVFHKYRLSKSSMPWTFILQSFSRVCVRVDFIVFNKWVWVEWFMTSLIFHLFVVVLSRIAKEGDS